MTRLSMRFDLRVPPFAKTSFPAQHAAMLEMAEWADDLGAAELLFSEHHGDPAGFSSAPLTLAAAALARTKRIAASTASWDLGSRLATEVGPGAFADPGDTMSFNTAIFDWSCFFSSPLS